MSAAAVTRGIGLLVGVLAGVGAAWLLVGWLAPGSDMRVALGLAALMALVSGLGAGNTGEALVIVGTLGGAFALGLFTVSRMNAELPLLRPTVLAIYAGICGGQLVGAAFNEFLGGPPTDP